MYIYEMHYTENDKPQFSKYFSSMKKAVSWVRKHDPIIFGGEDMDKIVTENNCNQIAQTLSGGQKWLFCACQTMGTFYSIIQHEVR